MDLRDLHRWDLTPKEAVALQRNALPWAEMLTAYINAAMGRARYKIIEDGTYFGEIPGLQGVWANASGLEACRQELQEVLEDWLIVKLRDGDPIPRVGRLSLVPKTA